MSYIYDLKFFLENILLRLVSKFTVSKAFPDVLIMLSFVSDDDNLIIFLIKTLDH